MEKRIVIIGAGVAGNNVLLFLLENRKDEKITVLKKEEIAYFSTCGIMYPLQEVHGLTLKNLILKESKAYIDQGVDFRTNAEVTGINLDENSIDVGNEKIEYDELVIATGKNPFIPEITGTELESVCTISNEIDAELTEKAIKDEKKKNAVVIGGGMIGLEAAIALLNKNKKVTVIEKNSHLMPAILDPDMSSLIKDRLEEIGVKFIIGKPATSINGEGKVEGVTAVDEEILADVAIVTAGVSPNVDLAKDAGVDIGELGGIVTGPGLHVKRNGKYLSNVYAAGDCIEVISGVTNRSMLCQMGSAGAAEAKVVADNILGGSAVFEPCFAPTSIPVAGMNIASVGITSSKAAEYGIQVIEGKATKIARSGYFPGVKNITLKMLFDTSSRLIGAQAISGEPVAERMNTLMYVIKNGVNAREMLYMPRVFDASVALLVDVTVNAITDALKKM